MKRILSLTLCLMFISSLAFGQQVINGSRSVPVANEGATGTTLNKLVKLTGTGTGIIAAISDTSGVVGICSGSCGITGNAAIARFGLQSCVFDGATTANDYVQISSTVAGDCHDTGSTTYPTTGQVLGRVLSTNGGGGTYNMLVSGSEVQASTSGGASTVSEVYPWGQTTSAQGPRNWGTNQYWLYDFFNPVATGTLTKVCYNLGSADNNSGAGHQFDIGVFDITGATRYTHIGTSVGLPGTTFAPTAGTFCQTVAGFTLPAGRLIIAMTSDNAGTGGEINIGIGVIGSRVETASCGGAYLAGATTNGVFGTTITPPALQDCAAVGTPLIWFR